MSAATKIKVRSCDNCALMDLHLCGDGLLHRYCTAMNLHIAVWNTNAVCALHKLISKKGGAQ